MSGPQPSYCKHVLKFKIPGGTSRGILHEKESWFITLRDEENSTAIGECGVLKGLSIDDTPGYEEKLAEICSGRFNVYDILDSNYLDSFPSIRAGLEQALLDLENGSERLLFRSEFTDGNAGIPINGLIWMGDTEFMLKQIHAKISEGFKCLKMKVGALDFDRELSILTDLREEFSHEELELRVDANGAFTFDDVSPKLEKLARLDIHSIEQPIKAGQWEKMAEVCRMSEIPVALDEELIGINGDKRTEMIQTIQPAYIILKPSLIGGFKRSDEWISIADRFNVNWWVTSALESNIGLNAIAQWTYTKQNIFFQGLGTGSLYTNNIPSPLAIRNASLFYDPTSSWDLKSVFGNNFQHV